MTVTHRRILYLSFFMLFLIAAPVLVFWAAGYRYDWGGRAWYRTGLLVLDVTPTPDTVLLNGQTLGGEGSPMRVEGVVPGEYRLELIKQGYRRWERSVVVRSGQATNIQDIRLWKDSAPSTLSTDVRQVRQASDQNLFALLHDGEPAVTLFRTDTGKETTLLATSPSLITSMLWSRDSRVLYLQFSEEPRHATLAVDNPNSLISLPLNFGPDLVAWDNITPRRLLFLQNGNLISYGLDTATHATVAQSVLAWYQTGIETVVLERSLTGTTLLALTAGSSTSITTLPAMTTPRFVPSDAAALTIVDEESNTLFVVDRSSNPATVTQFPGSTFAAWSPNRQMLLYGSAIELSLYDFRKRESTLLDRSGEQFDGAAWLDENTILVAHGTSIAAITTTGITRGQETSLATGGGQELMLDQGRQSVYFLADGVFQTLPLF